jgi:hypothetical protein
MSPIPATTINSPMTQERKMMIGYIRLLNATIVEGCQCEQCDDRRYNVREMTAWLFA